MLKIAWLRHNKTGKSGFFGQSNIDAEQPTNSQITLIQEHLGQFFGPNVDVDIYFSTLKRTHQGWKALKHGIEKKSLFNIVQESQLSFLNEQNFGILEGLNFAEISTHKPDLAKDIHLAMQQDPAGFRPDQGESFVDLCKRFDQGFQEHFINLKTNIASQTNPHHKNILCIAHAGIIRAQLRLALGLSHHKALSIAIAPFSLTLLHCFNNHDLDNSYNQHKIMDQSQKHQSLGFDCLEWSLEATNIKAL